VEERQSNPSRYYQYLEIERSQIRLIYITPENIEQFIASGEQSLFITIHHASLEEVRGAVAFSYCWGDPNVKKAVFANGKLLYIPSTLWRALRRQYPQSGHSTFSLPGSREDDRPGAAIFWADAICINQDNVLEKNHQIPLMGAIYSQARQVLVYVNEASNSLATLLYMQMITEAAENHDPWTVVSDDIISQELSRVDWNAVQEFFTQAVFRRSWVIQEIVLATNITICYGTTRLKLDHIQACLDAIRSNHIRPANSVLGVTPQTKEELQLMESGVQQLFSLARVKSSRLEGNPMAFMEVLRRFRGANATDPRDKVYSLLSLAPEKYKSGLVLDYSASNTVADVYKQLARCAIEARELESLLLNAGISQTVAGLPTWVPDWSYEPRHMITSEDFTCSGPDLVAYILFSPTDSSKLTIRGAIVAKACPRWTPKKNRDLPDLPTAGVVGTFTAVLMVVYHLISAGREALGTHGGLYPNGDDFSTAVWQTLICGSGWGERKADKTHYEAFMECYREALDDLRASDGRAIPMSAGARVVRNDAERLTYLQEVQLNSRESIILNVERPALSAETNRLVRLEEKFYPFSNTMMHFQAGRRTCTTQNRYFGTVPDEAEEEDLIVIFFGIRVPFVLRPVGDGTFKLIGHCYVHGIMGGELMVKGKYGRGIKVRGVDSVNFTLV
jgi:hypothetical protein